MIQSVLTVAFREIVPAPVTQIVKTVAASTVRAVVKAVTKKTTTTATQRNATSSTKQNQTPQAGVYTLGLSGSAGFGAYGTGAVGIALGGDGSVGIFASYGGGGSTGLNLGVGPQIGYSKGVGISSLRGTSAYGGVSVRDALGGGFDFNDQGWSAGLGLGFSGVPPYVPFEGHVGIQNTMVLGF